MFLGHFAVGFAAKKFAPRSSEAVLLAAPLAADILWPFFLLLGWEQVRIDPGNTRFTPFDFVSYPWSHSLLTLCVWATAFGGIYYMITRYGAGLGDASPGPAVVSGRSALRAGTVEFDRRHDGGGDCDVRGGRVDVCAGEGSHRALCIHRVCGVAAGDLCRRCLWWSADSVGQVALAGVVAPVILIPWAWWFDRHRAHGA